MRTTRLALTKTKVNGRRYFLVTTPKLGGGRTRRFFKDKAEAETYLQLAKVQQQNHGTAGLSFNDRQRAEYLECVEKLQPLGVTLRDATSFYADHLKRITGSRKLKGPGKNESGQRRGDRDKCRDSMMPILELACSVE